MNQRLVHIFKKQNIGVKLSLLGILVVFCIQLISFVFSISEQQKQNLPRLSFLDVDQVYFQNGLTGRYYYDSFIKLVLEENISIEDFNQMKFEISGEKINVELSKPNEIKILLEGDFEKDAKRKLVVTMQDRVIYTYSYSNIGFTAQEDLEYLVPSTGVE